jgi:lysophospholipase L1-like esterase
MAQGTSTTMKLQRFLLLCPVALALTIHAHPQQPDASANPAIVPASRPDAWWQDRHQQKLGRVHQGACDLLFIGDSITHNYEKIGPAPDELFHPTWEFFYGARRAINLGFSGDETEHVLWRIDHGEVDGIHPKVTVVLIGTNNSGHHHDWTAAQNIAGLDAVIGDLHSHLPHTKILLLGILPTDLGEKKTAIDEAVNEHMKSEYAHSKFVTVLDIKQTFYKDGKLDTSLFYDTRFKTPAGALHPDTHGQALMAAAIEPALSKLLGDTNRLTFHPNPLDPPTAKPVP